MCISGPEFTIEGNLTSASEQVNFQAGFGSSGDENLVKNFEWYLNGEVVSGNDKLFDEKVPCGTHALGLRILSADGWSGIKYVSFQTCVGALNISFNGPENVNEGGIGVYQLIANYANGQIEDITNQYVFSSTEGSFTGSTLSIPDNSLTNDSRQITITASKPGFETLTRQITIVDKTAPQSIAISGTNAITEGSSATYAVVATFQDGHTETLTNQYTFSSTEGTFTGSTLTIPENSNTNDSRQITIAASKTGSETLTKQINIIDKTSAQSVVIFGPTDIYENSSIEYSVHAIYQDGHIEDISSQYTFTSSEGTFSGSTLTIPANSNADDARQIIITATKQGSPVLTMEVNIIDQTIVITGPDLINEGDSATYKVTQNQYNLTSQYNFTSSAGSFSGSTLNIPTNTVVGDSKQIIITANKTGSAPITKQINVIDTTVIQSIRIEGPSSINEGEAANYLVVATYGNGATENVTNQYTFSSPQGSFTENRLTIPTNTTVGDTRQIIFTAIRNGWPTLQREITINDTSSNPALGVLTVDFLGEKNLNAIGFIDNTEIIGNHNPAYTGRNIIPIGSQVSQALVLASDLMNPNDTPSDFVTNWRFEFNLQKLVNENPSTSQFVFFIKGRSIVNRNLRCIFTTKPVGSMMTMTGSPGSYVPSATLTSEEQKGDFRVQFVAGANNSYSEQDLVNVLRLVYNVNSRIVSYNLY